MPVGVRDECVCMCVCAVRVPVRLLMNFYFLEEPNELPAIVKQTLV